MLKTSRVGAGPGLHVVDLIDLDAGRIASGEATVEETGWDLFQTILDVASGRRQTWTERWKLSNSLALFNPAPIT